jgi:hypothetical protein
VSRQLKVGDEVEIYSPYEDLWWPARIEMLLSAQLLAVSDTGRVGYALYNGVGVSWRPKK